MIPTVESPASSLSLSPSIDDLSNSDVATIWVNDGGLGGNMDEEGCVVGGNLNHRFVA